MGEVMLWSALAILIVMLSTWAISVAIRNASIVDIVWGLGFVVVGWVARATADGDNARQWLLTVMVSSPTQGSICCFPFGRCPTALGCTLASLECANLSVFFSPANSWLPVYGCAPLGRKGGVCFGRLAMRPRRRRRCWFWRSIQRWCAVRAKPRTTFSRCSFSCWAACWRSAVRRQGGVGWFAGLAPVCVCGW